jgi:hypothetical protein
MMFYRSSEREIRTALEKDKINRRQKSEREHRESKRINLREGVISNRSMIQIPNMQLIRVLFITAFVFCDVSCLALCTVHPSLRISLSQKSVFRRSSLNHAIYQGSRLYGVSPSGDEVRFAAQFQPFQALVCVSILAGFSVIQSRIVKSNGILESIYAKKKELQKMKSELLGGDQDALGRRQVLENEIDALEAEWVDIITLISFPGLTLRFRLPQPASMTDPILDRRLPTTDGGRDTSDSASAGENSNAAVGSSNQLGLESTSISADKKVQEKTNRRNTQQAQRQGPEQLTVFQQVIIAVGAAVVVILAMLLNLLLRDPMSSASSSSF